MKFIHNKLNLTHLKKNKKAIYSLFFLLILILTGIIMFNYYTRPIHISKEYTGLWREDSTNEFTSNATININGTYQTDFTIKKFKPINKLTGSIIVNNEEYELFGMDITSSINGLKYIGATGYEDEEGKYYVYILDNFESIVIFEQKNGKFFRTFCAPAETSTDFDLILNKFD